MCACPLCSAPTNHDGVHGLWLENHPVIRLVDQNPWVFQTAARGGLDNPPHTQFLKIYEWP